MKKELLTVGKNNTTQKYFIMGNHGQLPNTPYFNNYRDCMIAILTMKNKTNTNIYDMSQNDYRESFS